MAKLEPHQERVVNEKSRHDSDRRAIDVARHILESEKGGLDDFIENNPSFKTLHQYERGRMKLQRILQAEAIDASSAHSEALLALSAVLGERIAAF